jgi:N-acetylglucosaminyldiphosphoundecaprenol N-acetyl-beta-D-mannosaminyltransferase
MIDSKVLRRFDLKMNPETPRLPPRIIPHGLFRDLSIHHRPRLSFLAIICASKERGQSVLIVSTDRILGRKIYSIMGLPFDALSESEVVEVVLEHASNRRRLFISTPNLNFLVTAFSDPCFRDSVLQSDLSIADGMPVVWLARLLGAPIRERVSGAGLFEALRRRPCNSDERLRVFFFGGDAGVAQRACETINRENGYLQCVGWHDPGFGDIDSMSQPRVIDQINASGADFLVVSLGAKKGQAWIMKNMSALETPLVSHLGAVVNFVAGTVPRAPVTVQRYGLEWLWRIKAEPALWRRYLFDGLSFVALISKNVLPMMLNCRHSRQTRSAPPNSFELELKVVDKEYILRIAGDGCGVWPDNCEKTLRSLQESSGGIVLDCSTLESVGPGAIGLMMSLRIFSQENGRAFQMQAISANLRKQIQRSRAGFVLEGY